MAWEKVKKTDKDRLYEALVQMVQYDRQRGGVVEVEPQEEWTLWWESHPDGKESEATYYGNLGDVIVQWIEDSWQESNGNPEVGGFSADETDRLRELAIAYSRRHRDEHGEAAND